MNEPWHGQAIIPIWEKNHLSKSTVRNFFELSHKGPTRFNKTLLLDKRWSQENKKSSVSRHGSLSRLNNDASAQNLPIQSGRRYSLWQKAAPKDEAEVEGERRYWHLETSATPLKELCFFLTSKQGRKEENEKNMPVIPLAVLSLVHAKTTHYAREKV